MADGPDFTHPVFVHFYRAVVSHMDVWRQRMDATTNWAAATSAGMVTFSFGSVDSPHFVLLLALGFNGVFLLMESRRYQIFDLWRGRFRMLNRYLIAPILAGGADADPAGQRTGLARLAEDLGHLVPRLSLAEAMGFRIRRNYAYLFAVAIAAWLFKLEVHPTPARSFDQMVARAAVGVVPGEVVFAAMGAMIVAMFFLAVRAPTERMLDWENAPSPLERWVSRANGWTREAGEQGAGGADRP